MRKEIDSFEDLMSFCFREEQYIRGDKRIYFKFIEGTDISVFMTKKFEKRVRSILREMSFSEST